jgi:hypothetical protein
MVSESLPLEWKQLTISQVSSRAFLIWRTIDRATSRWNGRRDHKSLDWSARHRSGKWPCCRRQIGADIVVDRGYVSHILAEAIKHYAICRLGRSEGSTQIRPLCS